MNTFFQQSFIFVFLKYYSFLHFFSTVRITLALSAFALERINCFPSRQAWGNAPKRNHRINLLLFLSSSSLLADLKKESNECDEAKKSALRRMREVQPGKLASTRAQHKKKEHGPNIQCISRFFSLLSCLEAKKSITQCCLQTMQGHTVCQHEATSGNVPAANVRVVSAHSSSSTAEQG